MMTREQVQRTKEKYPEGTKIRLVRMYDDPCPVESGTTGVVQLVDGIGNIHIKWDNGRTLALCPEVDKFEVIS